MMTMIIRLCALCMVSSLIEMFIPGKGERGRIRLISGLLMIRLTIIEAQRLTQELLHQNELTGFFECLMR